MWRNFGACLAGYLVMALIVIGCFGVLAVTVPEVFRGQDGEAKILPLGWTLTTLAFGLLAAVAGGFVCQKIAGAATKPAYALAGISAILALTMSGNGPQGYVWVAIGNAIVCVAGIVIGARLARAKASPAPLAA